VKPKSRLSIGFLYDDTLDSTDGVAQYVKTLGAWLSSRGHRVSYLVGETKTDRLSGGRVYSLARNKSVVFNANRLSIPLLADRGAIKQALANEQLDVLHVQVPYSPLMSQIAINRADKSTVIVGTFHVYPAASWVEAGTRLLRLVLRNSLKKFDQIISVSQPAADFARKTFGIDTLVVPNAVDISRFRQTPPKDSQFKRHQIVFLGRLVKRKGCLPLLKAFSVLKETMPSANLTIAGDGPLRPVLERYIKQKGLGSSVKLTGIVAEEDKARILAGADIACFPSLYGESFGIVLIEAMAAGARVVLGGNNPGYSAVLGQQDKLLIDPLDTAGFAARLAKLLRDEQLAQELHRWQLSEVKKYDIATVGPKIESIYRRAIASRAKSRHN